MIVYRQVASVISLIGALISVYLWLWKIGVLGSLACGTGACETVQLSPWGEILGIPVAAFGVAGYLLLFAVSLWGIQPRWVGRVEPTLTLVVLSVTGVMFSAYLTYLEAFVIEAWCRWCVVSAVVILLVMLVSLLDLARVRRLGGDDRDGVSV